MLSFQLFLQSLLLETELNLQKKEFLIHSPNKSSDVKY